MLWTLVLHSAREPSERRYSWLMAKNLIPTKVVDKNGRLTTVHKRGEEPTQVLSSIPAPIVSPVIDSDNEARIARIIDEIGESVSIESEDEVRWTLESYSPEFLVTVEAALQELETVTTAALLIQAGDPQHLVSEAITFLPQVKMLGFYEAVRVVQSLHGGFYPDLPKRDDYSIAEAQIQSQCVALLKVTLAMQQKTDDRNTSMRMVDVGESNFDRVAIMSDQRMIALVLERPQDADLIVDTITNRRTGDFGVIHAVLNSEAIALSGGTL